MFKLNESACDLLRLWESEGRPTKWHVAPILADACEESGMDDAKKLGSMRLGRMVYRPFPDGWDVPIFDDEDLAVANGMPESLRGYDWREAFGYAGEEGTNAGGRNAPTAALPGDVVDLSPFARKDVTEVLAMVEGENDGPSWVCIGRLRDGRWFTLDAGCDYTGWDCQAGGSATVANDLDTAVRHGLGSEQRVRLGLGIVGMDDLHMNREGE